MRLDALGVAPGWRCLISGAGGGAVSRWLRIEAARERVPDDVDVDAGLQVHADPATW